MALLLACGGPGTVRDSSVETSTAATVTSDRVASFRRSLVGLDYSVVDGELRFLDEASCCADVTCWKRTESVDYGVYYFPLAEAELPHPTSLLEADGKGLAWRLDPNEAVVLIVRTPPRAKYFSFRSYVHDRQGASGRATAFASLGDTLNLLLLGTEGGEAFEDTTVVITTADRQTAQDVTELLVNAGFTQQSINIDVLPGDLVNLGLNDEADTIRMNFRVAAILDEAERAAYLASPGATLLRVSPNRFDAPIPYPHPDYRQPGNGGSEDYLLPALDALRSAILEAHADLTYLESGINIQEPDPNVDCWPGCNRDATYSNTNQFNLFGDDDFLLVYGVNHEATGMATYANAVIFGAANDDSGGAVDSQMMPGSARFYLPDHPDADLLYAWRFARNCIGQTYCTEVPYTCPGVDIDERASIHYRAYLDPFSFTHPLASELLVGGALKYQP
ncbi:MAG: hypothetical protein GWP91_24325 [Rhodobacterales bacterium]|nr:hypothetical protein [Rhodobacterales bacterium]